MRSYQFIFVGVVCFFAAACSSVGVTRYDPNTYQRLTDLKPEVVALYDTFSDPDVDPKAIASVRLKINQLYEYEKGKGAKNSDTAGEVEIIRNMFLRQTSRRMSGGKWTDAFKSDEEENISEAFDTAIQSEALKNK